MAEEKTYDFSVLCRHCDQETLEPVEAAVTGVIPDYAHGLYVYNGPGLTKVGNAEYKHCFDSSALLQKISVSVSDGCTYSCRYLQSDTLARNRSAGTITVSEFGTGAQDGASKGLLTKIRKMVDTERLLSDNAVVSVAEVAKAHYALGETPFMLELNLTTLEVKKKRSLYKDVGLITQCPHHVQDDEGNSYTVGQAIALTGPKYCVVFFPKDGSSPRVIARVSPRWRFSPCYMHSVGMTEHYLLLLEQPLAVSVMEAVRDMISNTPFIDCIKWTQDTVLVHVLDLRTGNVLKQRFVLSSLFMLHYANCYEDEQGDVVMDFPSYADAGMLHDMYIEKMRSAKGDVARELCCRLCTTVTRVVLPITTTAEGGEVTVTPQTISKTSLENPLVNPLYRRRRHRFIYGSGHCPEGKDFGTVTKLDVQTGEVKTFTEEGLYTGEAVFVPRPGATAEDAGVLAVVCVFSLCTQRGALIFLDAATMTEEGRVNFTAAGAVPLPLHGTFVPTTNL